jgi:hypothetical protein
VQVKSISLFLAASEALEDGGLVGCMKLI